MFPATTGDGRIGGPDVLLAPQPLDGSVPHEQRMRELHRAHAKALSQFLVRLTLGDQALAEDLVQETMLRVWRKFDLLPDDVSAVRPWLFTVARNIAIDRARARQSRPAEVDIGDISWVGSPSDAVEALLTAQTVREALVKLTPEHRAVLVELYYRGASVAEAAARIGIPEGTVRSRSFYALRVLRSILDASDAR
jgi:RNA polymerase sigma-70 factor (ECF subfamily)